MFLLLFFILILVGNLLHACGDVSTTAPVTWTVDRSAPRMWRCFLPFLRWRHSKAICSTHVEMFLDEIHLKLAAKDLLHACGDVSLYELVDWRYSQSAPRMWRCFRAQERPLRQSQICSTHVEMFPGPDSAASRRSHLLHACGDVSGLTAENSIFSQSAPRMWRCFPLVHMWREIGRNLLHACGDVSPVWSDRTWPT